MTEVGQTEVPFDRPSAAYLSMVATHTTICVGSCIGASSPNRAALSAGSTGARTFQSARRCWDYGGSSRASVMTIADSRWATTRASTVLIFGTPWKPRAPHDGRLAFAYYTVAPVDPEAVDNRFLHALLLDYGDQSPNEGLPACFATAWFRVERGSDDLLLGHTLAAVGRHRVPVGWFVLERLRPITEPASRLPWAPPT